MKDNTLPPTGESLCTPVVLTTIAKKEFQSTFSCNTNKVLYDKKNPVEECLLLDLNYRGGLDLGILEYSAYARTVF